MAMDSQGGCWQFTKFVFIFFNILFFLIGGAALGVGIWAQVSKNFTETVYELLKNTFKLDQSTVDEVVSADTVDNAAILIIVGGAIVMLIGFIGCFGAMCQNKCLLMTFFVMLFLILGVLVAGVILFAAFPDTVEANFKPAFEKVFDEWVKNPAANGTIVLIQENLNCCGINGEVDYTSENKTIPASCKDNNGDVYSTGCVKAFRNKFNDILKDAPWIIGGIGIGVLALLLIGMILSCCLFCGLNGDDGKVVRAIPCQSVNIRGDISKI